MLIQVTLLLFGIVVNNVSLIKRNHKKDLIIFLKLRALVALMY